MKYAIISDIDANLPALQAVLQDLQKQQSTGVACLGDIVGNGPAPKECLDIIRSMNIPCVKGDLDEYCSGDRPLDSFNPKAAAHIEWTRQQLTQDDRAWLRGLKYVETVAGFTIVHGTLNQPERWAHVFDRIAATASFELQGTTVCFFGHTHVPVVFIRDTVVRGGTYSKFTIEPGRQYFANPGSVGHPRDNNPKASYATYDLDERLIELHRVHFDALPGTKS